MPSLKRLFPVLFFIFSMSLASTVHAAPADLDQAFVPVDTYGHVARFSIAGGIENAFPFGIGFNGDVNAVLRLADGKFLVGGSFTEFNGVARNRIARLNADGTLDASFDPGLGFNGTVEALALGTSSSIYVGGKFTEFNGVVRNSIAHLNADGSLDTSFAPSSGFSGQGSNTTVHALAFNPSLNRLYAGGFFTTVNGVSRANFASLVATSGGLDTSFAPGALNAEVRALTINALDNDIYVGGDFTLVGGADRTRIVRFNDNGSVDTAFMSAGGGFDAPVRALAIVDNGIDHDIYAAGDFTNFNSALRSRIARLNSNGSLDGGFAPSATGFSGSVYALALSTTDSDVYAAGDFISYNGVPTTRILRFNSNGNQDVGFDADSGAGSVDATIKALAVDGTSVFAAGSFTSLEKAGFDGDVNAVVRQADGKFVVAGNFTKFNGVSRNRIARLNADGTLDASFDPHAGFDNEVRSIAIDPNTGDIYAVGSFIAFNNVSTGSFAVRLSANGTLNTAFTGPSSLVMTGAPNVVAFDPVYNRVYLGGEFTFSGRQGLLALNTTGSIITSLFHGNSGGFALGSVNTLLVSPSGELYVGGVFAQYRGTTLAGSHLIRLNTDGTRDTTFVSPFVNNGSFVSSLALASVNDTDKLYVGGNSIGLVRLNVSNGSQDPSFAASALNFNNVVRSLAIDPVSGSIYAGGIFTSAEGVARNRIARVYANGHLDAAFDPEIGFVDQQSAQTSVDALVHTGTSVIAGGQFTSYNNVSRKRIAKLEAGPSPAAFTVTETAGSTSVSESGTTDTFTVFLHAAPVSNVVLNVNSSDSGEATANPATLTFTPFNWNVPQTVTVTGVDDAVLDGTQNAVVTVSVDAAASSNEYDVLAAQMIQVAIADNEVAISGFTVTQTAGSTTVSESGTTDTFTVVLHSPPHSNVVLGIGNSDLSEITLSVSELTFTPSDWNIPQTVTVTGLMDFLADGTQVVEVNLAVRPAVSSNEYDGVTPQIIYAIVENVPFAPSFTVTETDASTALTEQTSDTFTVVLDKAPNGNVLLSVTPSDTSEILLDQNVFLFSPSDWNIPQTVTVLGQADHQIDGDQTVTIAISVVDTSTSDEYDSAPDVVLFAVVEDVDLPPGITIAQIAGGDEVTEAADEDVFSVVLESVPLSSVRIGITSSNLSEAYAAPTELVFTAANWNTPQSVHVYGVQDGVVDGTQTVTLTAAVIDAASSNEYDTLPDQTVLISVVNADVPGFTTNPGTIQTIETAGGYSNVSVRLDAKPLSNVVFNVSSDDVSEAVVPTTSFVFTPANWDTIQYIQVGAVDDAIVDGSQIARITISVDDAASNDFFDALSDQVVAVTILDNEPFTPGVFVQRAAAPTIVSENGTTDVFTVALAGPPVSNVVVNVSSDRVDEATVSPVTLTFTSSNWNVPQTVTVTGVNDSVIDGSQDVIITVSVDESLSSDEYDFVADALLDVVVEDNDVLTPAFTIVESSGSTSVSETGTTDTFTVVLEAQPAADVVLNVNSSDAGEATASLATLTFTSSDWNIPQTVTVTGADDAVVDGAQSVTITVSVDVASSSNEYDSLADQTVSVSVADNDVPVSYGMTLVESSGTTSVSEIGTSDDFTVVLTGAPASDVVVTVVSADPAQVAVGSSLLTFTSSNWNVPQTVTVTGVDNSVVDGTRGVLITVAVDSLISSPEYNGTTRALFVTITDNETPGMTVSDTSGSTDVDESGSTDTFDVVLNAAPVGDVVLTILSGTMSEASVSPTTLTFTSSNWNVPQTVTVTGVDDAVVDGTQSVTIVITVDAGLSSDEYDMVSSAALIATVADNDGFPPGFTVSETSGSTSVSETGTTDTFTVVLDAQPLIDVVLNVNSNDAGEATVNVATLTFTSSNWNVPQTVTVTGVDDVSVDGTQTALITISVDDAASYDPYDAVVDQSISVNVENDDVAAPALVVVQSAGTTSVSETGTTDTLTVALAAAPVGDVVLTVASSTTGEATVAPATLTFTSSNWSVAQTVTVTGIDDAVIDGPQTVTVTVSVDAAATSDEYDLVASQAISVSVADNDAVTPSISILETSGSTSVSENGSTDTFTVVLDVAPLADVTLNLSSSDTGEASVSPTTLTFTSSNWNAPQTITVTGVDDTVVDGTQTLTINVVVDAAATSDEYDAVASLSVTISVADNDTSSSGGGGGGGGGGSPQPLITINTPNGGEVLSVGQTKTILWNYQGSTNHTVRLDLSTDGGLTYADAIASSLPGTGVYLWTIPDKTSVSAKIRAQMFYGSSLVASDASDASFLLVGTDGGDLPRSGSGTGTEAIFIPSASINEDKGLTASASGTPNCTSGNLFRTASFSAVYYCGGDGKRYVFPNEKIYFSWYADFSGVTFVSDETMASVMIGGNVTYKPGVRMIKVESDPKTYLVSRGGRLRHVTTEAIATTLYGANWNTKIDDLPVGFFTDYTVIQPVTSADLP